MVDARLRTGERVNVILPPLALDGPVVTIRKFPRSVHDGRAGRAAAPSTPQRRVSSAPASGPG